MRTRFTSASCPNCKASFDRLPVDYDEDGGGYAVLQVTPCAGCGKLLCSACDQFVCHDGCGQTFCADHLVSIPNGTDRPLHCCTECAAIDSEAELLPVALPPARETRIAATAAETEVA